jgi:pimeloyl-ACP methyl ester carboxylesterase
MTTSQPCLCPTTTRYMASKVPCDRDRAISVPQTNLSPPNSSMSQLRDGRTLGVVEFGPRSGKVIFYFHGYPGSRFEGRFLSEPAERFGIRLIGVDRPGMGLSNFKARRHVLDWPNDVSELADILEIDQFSVVGFSAGGPYHTRFPLASLHAALLPALGRSDISYPCCPAACRGFCARSWRIFFKTTNELQRCSADLRGGGLRLTGRVLICLVSATPSSLR